MEKQPALAALCGLMDHIAEAPATITITCKHGFYDLAVQSGSEPT